MYSYIKILDSNKFRAFSLFIFDLQLMHCAIGTSLSIRTQAEIFHPPLTLKELFDKSNKKVFFARKNTCCKGLLASRSLFCTISWWPKISCQSKSQVFLYSHSSTYAFFDMMCVCGLRRCQIIAVRATAAKSTVH